MREGNLGPIWVVRADRGVTVSGGGRLEGGLQPERSATGWESSTNCVRPGHDLCNGSGRGAHGAMVRIGGMGHGVGAKRGFQEIPYKGRFGNPVAVIGIGSVSRGLGSKSAGKVGK